MQQSAFSYLASAIAATLGVTIENILFDIYNIRRRLIGLETAINACSMTHETSDCVVTMHRCAEDTWTAIIKTIKDVKVCIIFPVALGMFQPIEKTIPAPVSVADGTRVLDSIKSLKPLILNTPKTMVAKKAAFRNLDRRSILNSTVDDLVELSQTTIALEEALISRAPSELLDEANAIKAEIDNAFSIAIAAYRMELK